ncbi:hypothetical protein [Anabaena sp. PCC 7108]|uniref:hypothetical protein n=1 Tax=Anabaena sp. PCC 7108 TaxID=163908 RepID=UPI000349E4F1|nr:hypothetical protein [Anabaena sp. PCC 7108]
MDYLKLFTSLLIVVSAIFGLNRVASAQNVPRYIYLGDHQGMPVLFDTESQAGTTYKIYIGNGGRMTEITLQASCNESRLFIINYALYKVDNNQPKLLSQDTKVEEIEFNPKSILGSPMVAVCKKIGASGW